MSESINIQQAIGKVVEGISLTGEEMVQTMRQLMSGECTDAQIGGLLVALRVKGETVEEVAAAAQVMRELASGVSCDSAELMDIVGTGGDGVSTFNVSTCSALVAAAAGIKIAKHGNRAVSSSSGAADVLEAAGVNIDLNADQVATCVNKVGLGFMFAPKHHGAMKHAIGPRKDLAMRTIFNVLGPLTNPASAQHQLMGVYAQHLVVPMAEVLGKLGSQRAMVVHAEDGMDEISVGSATHVAELKDGKVTSSVIDPSMFSMALSDTASIKVSSAAESLKMVKAVLNNQQGPARDIVALNSGAAIYIAGITDTHEQGVERALELIAGGSALQKLDELVVCSNAC